MTSQYDDDQLPDPNEDEESPDAEEEPKAWAAAEAPAEAPTEVPAEAPTGDAQLKQQNELLRQQILQQQLDAQRQAANAVQQWLAQQPPEKQVEYRRIIEDKQREAEDKRRVMWQIAQTNALQGEYLDEFYELAGRMDHPAPMERLAARYKSLMEGGGTVKPKEKPAMARTRPDAGAPQGNHAGNVRQKQEKILKPFMPGGPKSGNLVEMDLEMQRNGFYG